MSFALPIAPPDFGDVASFVEGPGICRLPGVCFDVEQIQHDIAQVVKHVGFDDTYRDYGFGTLPVTRRPNTSGRDQVDLVGTYWLRPDNTYAEVERDSHVDEAKYTELMPEFKDTYIEEVVSNLRGIAQIGRVRINSKAIFNANSWHRDPEARLHVPIFTNPGSLFVVNHHCTHLPADGSCYFTDTRAYHTSINGGDHPRVHLVATLPLSSELA